MLEYREGMGMSRRSEIKVSSFNTTLLTCFPSLDLYTSSFGYKWNTLFCHFAIFVVGFFMIRLFCMSSWSIIFGRWRVLAPDLLILKNRWCIINHTRTVGGQWPSGSSIYKSYNYYLIWPVKVKLENYKTAEECRRFSDNIHMSRQDHCTEMREGLRWNLFLSWDKKETKTLMHAIASVVVKLCCIPDPGPLMNSMIIL